MYIGNLQQAVEGRLMAMIIAAAFGSQTNFKIHILQDLSMRNF